MRERKRERQEGREAGRHAKVESTRRAHSGRDDCVGFDGLLSKTHRPGHQHAIRHPQREMGRRESPRRPAGGGCPSRSASQRGSVLRHKGIQPREARNPLMAREASKTGGQAPQLY